MKQLSLIERRELLMARRQATKALKFITTNRVNTWNEFEITGDL